MKRSVLIFSVILVVLALLAGAAAAAEMTGTVSAVNAQKGMLKVKSEKIEAGFDCETGSILAGIKVGDTVTVEYTEAGGKKKATSVTPVMIKKTAPTGC